MVDGAVVERGKHDELVEHQGVYASQWTIQTGTWLECDHVRSRIGRRMVETCSCVLAGMKALFPRE